MRFACVLIWVLWIAVFLVPVSAVSQLPLRIHSHITEAHPMAFAEGVVVIDAAKYESVPETIPPLFRLLSSREDGYGGQFLRRDGLWPRVVGLGDSFVRPADFEQLILGHADRPLIVTERRIRVDVVNVNTHIRGHCLPIVLEKNIVFKGDSEGRVWGMDGGFDLADFNPCPLVGSERSLGVLSLKRQFSNCGIDIPIDEFRSVGELMSGTSLLLSGSNHFLRIGPSLNDQNNAHDASGSNDRRKKDHYPFVLTKESPKSSQRYLKF